METPTDMAFLELVNLRLDHLKAYNSERYYSDTVYSAKKWAHLWGALMCGEITTEMIQGYILQVAKEVSNFSANKELRCLKALFNFGLNPVRNWVQKNPSNGVAFLPVEKKIKYVPSQKDVLRVIGMADEDTKDYLWVIALTMGRMSEINRLTWDDVDLKGRSITLYTRKKKGGSLTPRKVAMSDKLYIIFNKRRHAMDKSKPWVFYSKYWEPKGIGYGLRHLIKIVKVS